MENGIRAHTDELEGLETLLGQRHIEVINLKDSIDSILNNVQAILTRYNEGEANSKVTEDLNVSRGRLYELNRIIQSSKTAASKVARRLERGAKELEMEVDLMMRDVKQLDRDFTKANQFLTAARDGQVGSLSSFTMSLKLLTNDLNLVSSSFLAHDFLESPRQRRSF